MRVGASTLPALPVPVTSRREGIAERQASPPNQTVAVTAEPTAEREVTRIRARASAAAQQAGTNRQQPFSDAVSKRARSALSSYGSNGPSIEERLGVQLAGIDVYA